jgi:hypothetical protein
MAPFPRSPGDSDILSSKHLYETKEKKQAFFEICPPFCSNAFLVLTIFKSFNRQIPAN